MTRKSRAMDLCTWHTDVTSRADPLASTVALSGVWITSRCAGFVAVARLTAELIDVGQVERATTTSVAQLALDVRLALDTLSADLVASHSSSFVTLALQASVHRVLAQSAAIHTQLGRLASEATASATSTALPRWHRLQGEIRGREGRGTDHGRPQEFVQLGSNCGLDESPPQAKNFCKVVCCCTRVLVHFLVN